MTDMETMKRIMELEEENAELKKQLREYRKKEIDGVRYKMNYFNTLAKCQELEKKCEEAQADRA